MRSEFSPHELHQTLRSKDQLFRSQVVSSKWSLLPEVENYLEQSSPDVRDLAVLMWCLNELKVDDASIWEKSLSKFASLSLLQGSYASSFMFSLAGYVSRNPLLPGDFLNDLKSRLGELVNSVEFEKTSTLKDVSQLTYATSVVFPGDRLGRTITLRAASLLENLRKRAEEPDIADLESCKEVCLLWSALRVRKGKGAKIPSRLVEALLEASRGLRFCSDMNQNKVAQICDSLAILGINDQRIVYQVILFVDTHKSEINQKNLLRLVRCMSKLRVDNEIFWKRIASRLEDPVGLRFSVDELEEIKRSFRHFKKNQRVMGILDLYIKTKVDEKNYGGF